MITNSSAGVISNNLYDLFGVKRYEQGSAQTQYRVAVSCEAELKKKIPGKLCKSLRECLLKCAKEFPDPSDYSARAECARGCLFEKWDAPSFVRWGVGIRNYLLCCYGLCDSASGWFMPPGGCEKSFK